MFYFKSTQFWSFFKWDLGIRDSVPICGYVARNGFGPFDQDHIANT
jgi:hypothetical protein